jgi:transposase
VAATRVEWRVKQLGLDPAKLVFLDETWAKTNMTRLRGRAASGQRLADKRPHGHWKTTTLIAALDQNGMRCSMTVDGAVNSQVFEAFVQQVLVPTLLIGQIVVMDNLSSHKGQKARRMIESAGASVVFLPPYSPDLNPIELAFSKLKQLLRSAGHSTMQGLWNDLQRMLDQITDTDAAGFFSHCGYPLQVK